MSTSQPLPDNVVTVTSSELLNQVLALYEKASDEHWFTGESGGKTIPVIVGAGISATADIPLGSELLEKLFSGLSRTPSVLGYRELYQEMHKVYPSGIKDNPDLFTSKVQEHFRGLLVRSGIPRRADHPFPNLSNLLLVHCVHSGVLGPLVSLNVDPLLQVAASFLEDGGPKLRYIQNISEFSDIVHDFETRLIIQPHGTIEEPLSLRFLDESLLDKDSILVEGISEQLEKAQGALCIGFSWDNGVIETIIEKTIDKRKADGRDYHILAACYGKVSDGDLSVLRRIAEREPDTVRISILENVRSDEFLEELAIRVYEKTKECRDEGSSTYYARDPARILALNRLVSWMHETVEPDLSDASRWSFHSSLRHLLSIECVLYFVAAGDPSSLYDLVKFVYNRPYLHELGYSDATEHARVIREVLESLRGREIIEEYDGGPQARNGATSLDDFDGSLYVLNSKLTMSALCESVLKHLTSSGERDEAEPLPERVAMLTEIFGSLEVSKKDRPQNILRAIALTTCFEKARIVPSSQALDELLDRLKERFEKHAGNGDEVTCYVYTETGDHLFKSEFHELKKEEWGDPLELKEYMLDWLHPLFDPANHHAKMKLLLPITDPSWRVDHSERSARASAVLAGLKALSTMPSITIGFLPWDRHDDHMWLLKVRSGKIGRSEGALFPRRHHESNHCSILIQSEHDVDQMIQAFESQAKQHGTTIKAVTEADRSGMPSWHVLAVTLVDGSTLDANGHIVGTTRICVGVRSAETNRQHKRVASVPTKKIPKTLFWDIVGGGSLPVADKEVLHRDFVRSSEQRGSDALVYAVDDLLASKLGVAEAVESRVIVYRAKPCVLKSGTSPLISDDDQDEYIRMVNALVVVEEGLDSFPGATNSYGPIAWVTVDSFLTAVKTQTALISEGDVGIPYICAGLCVCTSSLLLSEMDIQHEIGSGVAVAEGPLHTPPEIIAR